MSTNFDWVVTGGPLKVPTGEVVPYDGDSPIVHIGKRYAAGGGHLGFIWAQDNVKVREVCEQQAFHDLAQPKIINLIVSDEYDKLYTAQEFLDVLSTVQYHKYSIGERFS